MGLSLVWEYSEPAFNGRQFQSLSDFQSTLVLMEATNVHQWETYAPPWADDYGHSEASGLLLQESSQQWLQGIVLLLLKGSPFLMTPTAEETVVDFAQP